jgi:carbonic anhydrase/acetyltransferase-like protein (isoleucine patch superfamily)
VAIILPFNGHTPEIAESAYLAPNAVVVGNVTIHERASIWFGAVLRGDDPANGIVVGAESSVQDNCVVHVGVWAPTIIGENVTVGHGAKFESCTIGDRSVIGMNAVILQGAVIGEECVVAANAVVLENAQIPARSVVAGVPGRVKKTLEGSAAEWIAKGGRHYVELGRQYLAESDPIVCERCGGRMLNRHCKLVCLNCGYQRDCSDP